MYNSVTRAANEALLGYWNQKVAVDMDEVEEATDIISFINENPVLTPGHIIRKYIEEGGLGDAYSNIEWNKTTIRQLVNALGFDKDAKKWFTDEVGMTKDAAYHLAFRLKMNTGWLLQLLNAVDGGLVNYHDCSEIVYYFFIKIGNYNLEEADKMIENVKANANSTQIETPEKIYAQGYTNFATDVLEKLANSTLPESEKEEELYDFKGPVEEIEVTQESRQKGFDNYETTDDHGMVIIGKAEDQKGNKYYKVKNSWDTDQVYQGYFYVSEAYFLSKTMSILVNKKAVPSDLLKKMGL